MVTGKPQNSFPAKITNFLYERYKAFDGDKTKGLVFIPCELIDDMEKHLKNLYCSMPLTGILETISLIG